MKQNNTALNTAIVRILVVEDHPLFLEGLSLALQKLPSGSYSHCVGSYQEAKAILELHFDFDLILLDLNLPDGQGLSLLRYLQLRKLFLPVAFLSASEEVTDVTAAMAAGAAGFISKANSSDGIVTAIEKIINGEQCLPEFYLTAPKMSSLHQNALNLTPRQLDVLLLLAEGLPNKRICQRLELTEHTVKTHLKTLFQLLEVHNRTECVQKAVRLGLLLS